MPTADRVRRAGDFRCLLLARTLSLFGSFAAAVVIPFAVLSAFTRCWPGSPGSSWLPRLRA